MKYPHPEGTTTDDDGYRERAGCPVYTAIAVIAGRWKPMLYQRLGLHPHGFGELRRAVRGATAKVLREQLRQMEADGLIVKATLSPSARGVRYTLTPYGRTLAPVFDALWHWGTRHLARPGAARGTIVSTPARHADAPARKHGNTETRKHASTQARRMARTNDLRTSPG